MIILPYKEISSCPICNNILEKDLSNCEYKRCYQNYHNFEISESFFVIDIFTKHFRIMNVPPNDDLKIISNKSVISIPIADIDESFLSSEESVNNYFNKLLLFQ